MSYFWNQIENLPPQALVFGALIAIASVAAHAWSLRRLTLGRSEIRAALTRDGYTVHEIELRWLTRGPFPDMRTTGTRNSRERLYYVVADDAAGRRRTGWVRFRPRWPGQAADRWSVHWNDASSAKRSGLSTAQFWLLLLALLAGVLPLIALAWSMAFS